MSDRPRWLVMILSTVLILLAACSTGPRPVTATITATPPRTSTPRPTPTVTPTPTPTPLKSLHPTTLIYLATSEPDTLDPHLDYTVAGSGVLQNIYEGLITFDGADPARFVPLLAESIPEPVSAEDGVTYTWYVKRDVQFENGAELTAEDVAYSFWRAMLLGTAGSSNQPIGAARTPGFLLLDAFFDVDDAAQLVDPTGQLNGDRERLQAARAPLLRAACQQVEGAVTFDNATRSVTMRLRRPYAPFLATLAGSWAYVVNKNWLSQQGEWNGDCQTWSLFYGRRPEEGPLHAHTNGTGPYRLDHWVPGQEIELTARLDYRSGEGAIKQVTIQIERDFDTRLARLRTGAADVIDFATPPQREQLEALVRDVCGIDTGQCETIEAHNRLRVYDGLASINRSNVFFNFAVAKGSPYVGSGQLDGQGVPLDFFADGHVRRAFNYCFDASAYIQTVFAGKGTAAGALSLPDQPGYTDLPSYTFDLTQCAAEFKAASLKAKDDQSLWDKGFKLDLPYSEGDVYQQAVAANLADNVNRVNANFSVKAMAVSAVDFGRALRSRQLPLAVHSWQEDIHDAHNWYAAYLLDTYSRFDLPRELQSVYSPLIEQGVTAIDPAARAQIYRDLNRRLFDDAVLILLPYTNRVRYEPVYLKGWLTGSSANPLVADPGLVYQLSEK